MKLLYIFFLLGIFAVVILGSVYLSYSNKGGISIIPAINSQQDLSSQSLGRTKEDFYRKNYKSFVQDARINLTFTGRVREFSDSSITITDTDGRKLTLSNDNKSPITGVFSSSTNREVAPEKVPISNIKNGDLVEVVTSISSTTGTVNVNAVIRINSK